MDCAEEHPTALGLARAQYLESMAVSVIADDEDFLDELVGDTAKLLPTA